MCFGLQLMSADPVLWFLELKQSRPAPQAPQNCAGSDLACVPCSYLGSLDLCCFPLMLFGKRCSKSTQDSLPNTNVIIECQGHIEGQQQCSGGSRGKKMRRGAQQYVVARPLYSEESFAEDHETVYRHRKTTLDHIKQYFT